MFPQYNQFGEPGAVVVEILLLGRFLQELLKDSSLVVYRTLIPPRSMELVVPNNRGQNPVLCGEIVPPQEQLHTGSLAVNIDLVFPLRPNRRI